MSRGRRKMYFVKMNSVDMVKRILNTSYVIKYLVVLGDDDLYKIYFNWAIPFFNDNFTLCHCMTLDVVNFVKSNKKK